MIKFSQPPKSLCIFRLSAIGDVTHILPIIVTLKKQWPETKISWVIGKLEYQLVKSLVDVEFIQFNKSEGLRAYNKLRRQLKNRQFDVLLMMQAALRASIASLFIRAKLKIGFDKQRAIDFQWLFSNNKINGEYRVHVLDGFFQFLQAIGIQDRYLEWDLQLAPEDLNFALEFSGQQPYVVINPCSSARKNNWRNWAESRYAEIVDYLNSKNIRVILTGGPSKQEAAFAQSVSSQCRSEPTNLAGKTSLGELLAVLKNAAFVIAPDTGPAHMATIVDTPVIGLFASSNPARTGPYKSLKQSVDCYPQALKQFNQKELSEAAWGERVRDPKVMDLISVDAVKQRINDLLNDY